MFIETPNARELDDNNSQQRMLRLLTLATQMGGEVLHIEAETIEKGLLQLLETEQGRIKSLIIGNSESEGRLLRSPWDRAIRLARKQNVAIEIIPLSGQHYHRGWKERFRWIKLHHMLYALLAVSIAFMGALVLQWLLPPVLFRINNQNVGLLFMIGCAFTAGRFGMLPGLIASGASIALINYYFTVPYYAFKFSNVTDILHMILFFSATLLISLFASETHGYVEKSAKRELSTQALFTLYRLATNALSRKQALEELHHNLTRMLGADIAFFVPPDNCPEAIDPTFPPDTVLGDTDLKALELCWKEVRTTGFASPNYPTIQWRFEPMVAPGGEIGVLGIRPHKNTRFDVWFGRLLSAIADQTATVLEHIELKRTMEVTLISEERQKLRSMLLSSVSHDLKTPLASIIGALTIFRSRGIKLTEEKRETLIETALEESQRLESFITNILNMTHLESGKIEFKQEWHDAQAMVQQVTKRLEHKLRQHKLNIHDEAKNMEVLMDISMTEQVLQNVIENAVKYTPAGTLIEICYGARDGDKGFFFEVHDHGAGLPTEDMNRVFDKYARLQKRDSQVAGTGLGLAISKAIMEAQSGSITASNHEDGGAVFTMNFPVWRKANTTKYLA